MCQAISLEHHMLSSLQSFCAGEIWPVACTIRLRQSVPPISDTVMMCSGLEWTGITLPFAQGDACHVLEHGAAMWGITTDAESKQALPGDTRSDGASETRLGNRRRAVQPPPASLAFSTPSPAGFAPQPRGPFAELKTLSVERTLNDAYPELELMSGPISAREGLPHSAACLRRLALAGPLNRRPFPIGREELVSFQAIRLFLAMPCVTSSDGA
jgi:hypothetical protein